MLPEVRAEGKDRLQDRLQVLLTVVPLARPQPLFPLFGEAEYENRLQRWEGRLDRGYQGAVEDRLQDP